MTIRYIKSDLLRRTLIVLLVPLFPVLVTGAAIIEGIDAFFGAWRYQWGQGSGGPWSAIKECWIGKLRQPFNAEDTECR